MISGLSDALKGPGGSYELTRVLGAGGGAAYVIGAQAFVAAELAMGRGFDLTTYCLAFPSGLAAILAAIAGGASWKDKGAASAKVIEATGAVPAPPPAGPRVPVDEPDAAVLAEQYKGENRQPAPGDYGTEGGR